MTKSEEVLVSEERRAGWKPVRGDATEALGSLLVDGTHDLPNAEAFDRVVASSVAILSRCKPFEPTPGTKTGLVVGHVQSGKTVSMATVASVARDNGCRLVVLLAGVTQNLLVQTARERIRPYLARRAHARGAWRVHDTVTSADLTALNHEFEGWVDEWKRADLPEERRRPLFVTVMKHHKHLDGLCALLKRRDLSQIPALIIDDEADQASLDTSASRANRAPSTTYQRIHELRQALPNHTYLQYTATPQANLLIRLADMLSPDFAHVLEPGDGYTGGLSFFVENRELVIEIPGEDLFDPRDPPSCPPESLMCAMREFLVGATIAQCEGEGGVRSMLIHPSQMTDDHTTFHRFAVSMKEAWLRELRSSDERQRQGIVEDFQDAFDALRKTAVDVPPFRTVLEELPNVLAETRIWKVNSEDGHEVDWDQDAVHILVGGDKLNRGFTVRGLSVTYMPRKPGGWNADTIQQRARFFGYKASYLKLCRVYLHPDVADAYREYVHHEEDVRGQLREHEGRPLKEWRRAFLLNRRLQPTRRNVLSEAITRSEANTWFRQSYPHVNADYMERNKVRVAQLIRAVEDADGFTQHPRNPSHKSGRLPFRQVFDSFLVDYECDGNDAADWEAKLLLLADVLQQQPRIACEIVSIMGGGIRERSEDKAGGGRINQLFEGRRKNARMGASVSDKELCDPNAVTLQLHRLNVKRDESIVRAAVPAIAVLPPQGFGVQDMVLQRKHGGPESG